MVVGTKKIQVTGIALRYYVVRTIEFLLTGITCNDAVRTNEFILYGKYVGGRSQNHMGVNIDIQEKEEAKRCVEQRNIERKS